MAPVWRFLLKFASIIVCPLHCFDRVIFKGHLAMAAPSELERKVVAQRSYAGFNPARREDVQLFLAA